MTRTRADLRVDLEPLVSAMGAGHPFMHAMKALEQDGDGLKKTALTTSASGECALLRGREVLGFSNSLPRVRVARNVCSSDIPRFQMRRFPCSGLGERLQE